MGKILDAPLNAGPLHRYDLGSTQGCELMLIDDAVRYGLRSFHAEDSGRTDEMIQRRDFVPLPGRNRRASIDRRSLFLRSSSDGRLQSAKYDRLCCFSNWDLFEPCSYVRELHFAPSDARQINIIWSKTLSEPQSELAMKSCLVSAWDWASSNG